MLKRVEPDKVLVVRILFDLVNKSSVCKAHSLLQDKGAQDHTSRFGYVTCFR